MDLAGSGFAIAVQNHLGMAAIDIRPESAPIDAARAVSMGAQRLDPGCALHRRR